MQRSGIEGACEKFCAREVAAFVKAANPESQVVELGGLPEGVAVQRKRRDTRYPTQQQSPFCQSSTAASSKA